MADAERAMARAVSALKTCAWLQGGLGALTVALAGLAAAGLYPILILVVGAGRGSTSELMEMEGAAARGLFALGGALAAVCIAGALLLAGCRRAMLARGPWGACVALAVLGALVSPFGTVGGVWALGVLFRRDVRAAFGAAGRER